MGSGGRRAVKSTVQVTAGEQLKQGSDAGVEEVASVTVRPRSRQGWWRQLVEEVRPSGRMCRLGSGETGHTGAVS